MEDEKTLVIKSDSKVIRPKFKTRQFNRNLAFQKQAFENDIYSLNKQQIKNNDLLINDEDQKDIEDILEQINKSVQINVEDCSMEQSKINNQTSPEIMEILNILSQPIESCPKKRFTSKNNRYNIQILNDKNNDNINKKENNLAGEGITDSDFSNTRQQTFNNKSAKEIISLRKSYSEPFIINDEN